MPFEPSTQVKFGIVATIVALLLDQATKALALANATILYEGINVFPGLNLVLHHNPGVSFGMLGAVPWWVLTLVTLAICGVMVVLLWKSEGSLEALGYGLIIGGAIGNIVDRIRIGAVTDFLDFYYGDLHWPAFNLADTAIFCGAAAMIFSSFIETRDQAAQRKRESIRTQRVAGTKDSGVSR